MTRIPTCHFCGRPIKLEPWEREPMPACDAKACQLERETAMEERVYVAKTAKPRKGRKG